MIPEEVGETKDTLVGYADNYMKVEFEGSEDLIGEIVKVKINKADYQLTLVVQLESLIMLLIKLKKAYYYKFLKL